MIYYTSPSPWVQSYIDQGVLGSFDSPVSKSRPYRKAAWCADNGCFTSNYVGDEEYLRWLERASGDSPRCAFATAPDVLCDAVATLERSRPVLPRIRELGFPAALVAQNGLEDLEIPWDSFDVLFIGGDTEWKLGAAVASLAETARALGKRVHMGRVNGFQRLRVAASFGCESVDGNYLAHGVKQNLPRLLRWLADVNGEGTECVVCGQRFRAVQLTYVKTCSDRCRQRLSRQRRAQAR